MKIWPCITPIMIFFFNILSQQQHINKQIRRYTVFNGKPVYGIFYTHIA